MRKRNPFQCKQFAIEQADVAMPVTTDAFLFGALVQAKNPKKALDIGTGTGVLSLILAQRFESVKVDAVELDGPSAEAAAHNFQASPWAERLQVFCEDINELAAGNQYDLIVCNPPFFDNLLPSVSERKRQARHTGTLDFLMLSEICSKLQSPEGSSWILCPDRHKELAIAEFENQGMHLASATAIAASASHPVHLHVLELGFVNRVPEYNNVLTYEQTGLYTQMVKQLLSPFYASL